MKAAHRLVRFLVGDGIGLQQILPARRGNVRDLQVRLGILQVGLGLPKLLIEFRRLDFGKKLALLDTRTYIHIPVFYITISPGIASPVLCSVDVEFLCCRSDEVTPASGKV